MTGEELQWLIGTAVTVFFACAGIVGGGYNLLSNRLERKDAAMGQRVDGLHTRVNDVKEKYVRRDDFERHVGRLDEQIRELRDENRAGHRETNKRLDNILEAVMRSPPTRYTGQSRKV